MTRGSPAALVAKEATGTIPIVMASSGDPLRDGIVANLKSWSMSRVSATRSPEVTKVSDWPSNSMRSGSALSSARVRNR